MRISLPRIKAGALFTLPLLLIVVATRAPGQQPDDLSLWDTGMKPQKLSQYRGKIVILNFWATWCIPCKEELPMLAEEQKRYKREGVVVIGASLDDATTVKRVRPFAKKDKLDFPIWVGATVDHLEKLGLGRTIPATAFFDREGNLTGRVMGELREAELDNRIEWMLGKREGPAPAPLVSNLSSH